MSGLDKQLDEALGLAEAERKTEWPEASPAVVHFGYDTKIGASQGHPRYIEVDHLRKQVSRSGTGYYWMAGMRQFGGRRESMSRLSKIHYSIDFYKVRWIDADYNYLTVQPGDRLTPATWVKAGPGGFSAHKDPVVASRFAMILTFNPNNVVKIDWL